ncbi:MAG: hypothetical protein ABIT16_11325 [Croceibacterium sp.]
MDDLDSDRAQTASRRPVSMRVVAGIVLGAFLVGAAGVWYLTGGPASLGKMFSFGPDVAVTDAPTTDAPAPADPATTSAQQQAAAARVEQVAETQGGLDQRVAAMEQRLTKLDLQAQAAAGNAARAEGLLIAFATRRAIERGAPLGYLSDQLQLRFGDAQPNAVRTVIAAAQRPVTLDQLLAQLDRLEPELEQTPKTEGTIDWLSRQMGSIFVVRRADSPSPAPERRVERARLFLQSGRAEAAVQEVRLIPNAAPARAWLADAERYAAAQRALELLETAAILEPRTLRDGTGTRIEQASPASGR